MICPKCADGKIDDSGTCPACGFAVASESREPEAPRQAEGDAAHVGLIPMDYAGPTDDQGVELPAWRLELSRRLQEIKRRRETGEQPTAGSEPVPPPPEPEARPPAVPRPAAEEPRRRRPSQPRPAPAVALGPADSRPLYPPDVKAPAPPEATVPAQTEPSPAVETAPEPPAVESALRHEPAVLPKQANIQDLIDSIMTKKSPQPEAAPRIVPPPSVPDRPGEGKLILLSRTLSGLVDLLIVVLCAGAFILAADFISGIEVLDDISLLHYGQLLLAIFLLYSIFMLGTANQTMGMMITDLKVVRLKGERPSIGQVLVRTVAFLFSLLALGIGLAWALFDRECLCLHDRISGTEVVRI